MAQYEKTEKEVKSWKENCTQKKNEWKVSLTGSLGQGSDTVYVFGG